MVNESPIVATPSSIETAWIDDWLPRQGVLLISKFIIFPVPEIVNEAQVCKYKTPSFSLVDESFKVDSLDKTNSTALFPLINIGVNIPVFVNLNEFKYRVHDEDIIIFLLLLTPFNS